MTSIDCPICGTAMTDCTTLNWTMPFQATWQVGYCPQCSRRIHQDRDTGAYESFNWAPLCHQCMREVQLDREQSAQGERFYSCPEHRSEVWAYGPSENEWTWRGPDKAQV